jgi:hypothetical protein
MKMQKFASYAAFAISIFTLIIVISTGLGSKPWEVVNAMAAVISGLAASLGLLFVGLQLRSTDRLTKAQFINELAAASELYVKVESNLDRGGKWYDSNISLAQEDIEAIEKYLNFFERVKLIFDTKVLEIEILDELLAYRFFYLVHNPNVQSKILFNEDMQPYFRSIFQLYSIWLKYRQNKALPIPREDFIMNL